MRFGIPTGRYGSQVRGEPFGTTCGLVLRIGEIPKRQSGGLGERICFSAVRRKSANEVSELAVCQAQNRPTRIANPATPGQTAEPPHLRCLGPLFATGERRALWPLRSELSDGGQGPHESEATMNGCRQRAVAVGQASLPASRARRGRALGFALNTPTNWGRTTKEAGGPFGSVIRGRHVRTSPSPSRGTAPRRATELLKPGRSVLRSSSRIRWHIRHSWQSVSGSGARERDGSPVHSATVARM